MFESVCVGGLRNGKEVEALIASGGVQIARQSELALVLASSCRETRRLLVNWPDRVRRQISGSATSRQHGFFRGLMT